MSISTRATWLSTLIVLILLVFPTPDKAVSAPVGGTISSEGTWKYPKVRRDTSEYYFALYWDATNSAFKFVKWNYSTWEDYTAISASDVNAVIPGRNFISYGNEYRTNFLFDSQGDLHVVFSAGTSSNANTMDGIHGVYDGTSWSFELIADDINSPNHISLFIDASDNVHIAYVIDGVPASRNHILKYATNLSGSWLSHEILETANRGDDELHDTYIVVDSAGKVSVIFRREDGKVVPFDNYYETQSTDYQNFTTTALVLDGKSDLTKYKVGNIAVNNSDNSIHLVYSDLTNTTAYYSTNSTGSWVPEPLTSTNVITEALDIKVVGTSLYVLTNSNNGYLWQSKISAGSWTDGELFTGLPGVFSDRSSIIPNPFRYMLVSEDSSDWTANYIAKLTDSDGTLVAGTTTEPGSIPTTVHSGSPLNIFDFIISDNGATDSLPLEVNQITLNLSGTASTHFSKLNFNLTGCATENGVTPVDSTVTFSNTAISVADGDSTTCEVQAYWNNAIGVTDNQNIIITIDGDTDLEVTNSRTQMSGANAPVSTPAILTAVIATRLGFATQPVNSISGFAITPAPVVTAYDAAGNVDVDFDSTVTLGTGAAGALTNNSATPSSGSATFSNLIYTATADGEPFSLTATANGLISATSSTITSDVVATKLVYSTQPAGSVSGVALTTQPIVEAQDDNALVDVNFVENITLTEASSGFLTNQTIAAVAGVATFTNVSYTATADQEPFVLSADDQVTGTDLPTISSASLISDVVATKLVFTTQPSPLSVINGIQRDFLTDPIVTAQDGNNLTDTGFDDTVALGETGPGNALFTNNSTPAIDGVATFTGLTITYTASSMPESFSLQANDLNNGANIEGDLPATNSTLLVVNELPPPPSTPDLVTSSDSGASGTDNITNLPTPSFTGTAKPSSSLTLSSSLDGNIGTILTTATGSWSLAASSLQEGQHTITATTTDSIGTSLPSGPLVVTIDTTPPSAATMLDMAASSDSGVNDSDDITNNSTPVFSGKAEASSTITLNSSINGTRGSTGTDTSGDWSITSLALDNGGHDITIIVRDVAGNDSEASTPLVVTIDTSVPDAPTLPDLLPSSDSGVSDSDDRTNITTPEISGMAEANSTVTLDSDRQGNLGSTSADDSGNWSAITPVLVDGNHSISATATDTAGNSSANSAALTLTIDTVSPAIHNLPANMVVKTAHSSSISAQVSWSEPTATDNIDGSITPVQTDGPLNGSFFPLEISVVTYNVTDNQGNSTNESFTVDVVKSDFPWWILMPGLVSPNKVPHVPAEN